MGMMIEIATLMGLAVSSVTLLYLRNTNTKRRRIYNLPKLTRPDFQAVAWLVCLLPGLILLSLALYSSFIMWFMALSLVGWGVAVPQPKNIKR